MSFHRLEKAREKNFWSIRVNSDLQPIVHKTGDRILLCYVGHHDPAYHWAEWRKLETHPATGAAQLVEIRETVRRDRGPEVCRGRPPRPAEAGALRKALGRRAARLRRAQGATDELERIVRAAWPEVEILVRADSGFCREEPMGWCVIVSGVPGVLRVAYCLSLKLNFHYRTHEVGAFSASCGGGIRSAVNPAFPG